MGNSARCRASGGVRCGRASAGHDEIVRAKDTAQGGVEPPTLRLTATRSNQLSYQAFCLEATGQN